MSREEELDYLIEQRLYDAFVPPDVSDDDAARIEAAMTLAHLNAIEPPPALAERLEARIRTQARARERAERESVWVPGTRKRPPPQARSHQNGHVVPLARPIRPKANQRRSFKRAWISALAMAAVLVLAIIGVTNAAASSLPGDPLYALKQWEQQMALSNANSPAARANVQLTQLQSAIADLETAVNNGRSDADVTQALGIVATDTRDSQTAVSALPAGTERAAAEQLLASTLQTEQTTLYRLLGRGDWSLRLAFSDQLKALGAAVPTVTSVTITESSDDALKLTLTGANFAPGAQVVINGKVRGTVTQNDGTTLTAIIHESDWREGQSAVGVLNPDGTAGQKMVTDDDHHDGSNDGGDDDGGNSGPGQTPTPGDDGGNSGPGGGGGDGGDDGGSGSGGGSGGGSDDTVWGHPLIPTIEVTISGNDSDDAKRYQEQEVREALAALKQAIARQKKGQP